MVKKRTLAFATLAISVWAALATSVLGYYYLRFQEYVNLSREYEAVTMKVDIYIHYGNETNGIWHNNTIVPLGAALLNATGFVADSQFTYWSELGAAFIDSIDGVANNVTKGKSWFWWYWDTTSSKWILGEVGANQRMLHRRDIVAWTYQSYEIWPPPPPS
jgi:hypothetical protein